MWPTYHHKVCLQIIKKVCFVFVQGRSLSLVVDPSLDIFLSRNLLFRSQYYENFSAKLDLHVWVSKIFFLQSKCINGIDETFKYSWWLFCISKCRKRGHRTVQKLWPGFLSLENICNRLLLQTCPLLPLPALLLRLFLQGFDRHQWFVAPFIYCSQKRSSSVLILLLIKTYTPVSASKSILHSRTDYGKVLRPTHLIVGMIHFHIAKSSFTDR